MPLRIIIIGAGIGGLCAAVALRQAGHHIHVVEKSNFKNEVGAALLVTPNGSRVLRKLGFSFANAYGDLMTRWEVLDGITLATLDRTELADAEEAYGAPLFTMQRSDLHDELMRLVKSDEHNQSPVFLQTGTRVNFVDPELGIVGTEDNQRIYADLIVGADGLHSMTRSAVLDQDSIVSRPSGIRALRFQIPTATLCQDKHFQELQKVKGKGSTVLVDTRDVSSERHLVWYDCHDGQIQNFVGIHPTVGTEIADLKQCMLKEFAHFHPSVVHVIDSASKIGQWPLPIYDAFPSWHRNKAVLIGDAAHPMLPFSGQGSNQAIEDAGALGEIFSNVHDPSEIPSKLQTFALVRQSRASRIQIMSTVRLGKEKLVEEQLKRYVDPWTKEVPVTFAQRYEHDFKFDVFERCREAMQMR